MIRRIALVLIALSIPALASEPRLPIRQGRHTFQHRFAEQPAVTDPPVTVLIHGHRIAIRNDGPDGTFPHGLIEDGILMWHAKSKQWIVGYHKSDRHADAVGGCSDGPSVVDLKNAIYWTC